MEFTVIDANVVRSNCSAAEFSETDDLNDAIAKFKDIQCLDLCCLNILHIANLSLLSTTNLTSLKLSVNRIDKICNLDSFTNLVELDLSHNHIKKIENLQALIKLRRLILNHNPLTNVENLDAQLDSLEMLDVGCCRLVDLKFTIYLKRFKNLVSLIAEGNLFLTEPADSERKFIVAIVQSLLVYNNKTVTMEEKKEAIESYSKLVSILDKNEIKRKRRSEYEKSRLEKLANRKDAFLDQIPEDEDAEFNVSVFRNPTVEQVLRENNRYGIHSVYRTYAENFRRLMNEIAEAAESSRDNRTRLVEEFNDRLRRLIGDSVDESRRCTSGFAGYKKRLECDLREGEQEGVRSDSNATERASLCERFDKRARVVWLTLMGHEDDLSRKITGMIGDLRRILDKEIAEFQRLVKNRFSVLQRQQNVFLQFVMEYAVSSAQNNNTNNRLHRVSQFTNDISQCMESQSLQIERSNLYITESASNWLDNVFKQLNGKETRRNDQKILEIATFLRNQNETFKQALEL